MSKNSKEHKKDPHYKLSKKEGYRARSAYKLLDIEKRYNIFKRAFYILDIGSNPGSWLQVAKKIAEENLTKYKDNYYHRDHYKIMGVDIKKISPIEGIELVRMDATSNEFQEVVNNYFGDQLDLIISDASINKSGNSFSDQARQFNLCFKILNFAIRNLKPKGNFVIKVFQGADFDNFYKRMKKYFAFVKSYKPKATAKKSSEIYLIGLKKRN
ncbi:MAG: RlmE family RNA methyltransferase [Promethearchaeia archaeon]